MTIEEIEKFRGVLRKFEREIDIVNSHSSCCDVSDAQCHALLEIDNEKGVALTDLAQKLSLDKSTVSRTVDNLSKLNLIERTIPENNRRTVELKTTNKGHTKSKKIDRENNAYFEGVFEEISINDFNVFMKVFDAITIKMKELNDKKHE